MQLINMAAWMWALLAIPIIAFYVLKTRLRQLPVSSLLFWQSVFEEKKTRSIWQKLRHIVSLLVQIAFLILLVLALTEPRWARQSESARRLVLILDESASMKVVHQGKSRLDQAKQLAKAWIRGLNQDDELAVLVMSEANRLRCGLTRHQATLRKAVDGIQATESPSKPDAAVRTARQLIAGHPRGQILVISDRKWPAQKQVQYSTVGETVGNLAITRFQVRRSLQDPTGYDTLIEVANFSTQEAQCELALELRAAPGSASIDESGQIVDVIPLRLAPQQRWTEVRSANSGQGGVLVASLDGVDALAADNKAYAVLPDRKRQRVILVSKQSWFLRKAFESAALVDLEIVEEAPATVPPNVLLIFHGATPAVIPEGNVLVIEPQADCNLWTVGPAIAEPLIAKHHPDHELLRHIRLDNVLLQGARRLSFSPRDSAANNAQLETHRLLETASDDVVLAALTNAQRKVIVLSATLAKGDLALRTSFPILISNAIQWFQNQRGEWQAAVQTGGTIVQTVGSAGSASPANSAPSDIVLVSPRGERRNVPVSGGQCVLGPFDQVGLWKLGESALTIACNLSNESESQLKVPEVKSPAAIPAKSQQGWPLWMALVALAVVYTSLEWQLYQRRLVA